MGVSNKNLTKAKISKDDEFYTLYDDIVNELGYYKQYLDGKVVYCNCDNPLFSQFWRYFHLNFTDLGLKGLIATYYDEYNKASRVDYWGGCDDDILNGKYTHISNFGDMLSEECKGILLEADILITNPPFTLFRKLLGTLVELGKDFILVGNRNSVVSKQLFSLIKDNKVRIGYSRIRKFLRPDGNTEDLGNVCWYTTLPVDRKPLELTRSYYKWGDSFTEEYIEYDNYNAIEVGKLVDIPVDYFGVMGVPITFIDKHCQDQFKIVGLARGIRSSSIPLDLKLSEGELGGSGEIRGRRLYARILICRNH